MQISEKRSFEFAIAGLEWFCDKIVGVRVIRDLVNSRIVSPLSPVGSVIEFASFLVIPAQWNHPFPFRTRK